MTMRFVDDRLRAAASPCQLPHVRKKTTAMKGRMSPSIVVRQSVAQEYTCGGLKETLLFFPSYTHHPVYSNPKMTDQTDKTSYPQQSEPKTDITRRTTNRSIGIVERTNTASSADSERQSSDSFFSAMFSSLRNGSTATKSDSKGPFSWWHTRTATTGPTTTAARPLHALHKDATAQGRFEENTLRGDFTQ